MSIPIEQPPAGTDPDTVAWVNRVLISIAGELENMNAEIEELSERVKVLESKTP